MPNTYPDSIVVLAEMIPDVRISLIHEVDSKIQFDDEEEAPF